MSARAVLTWWFVGCALVCAPSQAISQQTAFDGTRYGSLTGQRATVLFAPEDSLVAERVRDVLDGQPPLPGLPDTLPSSVTAVLAHSPDAFTEAIGAAVPEWSAGVAIPSLNRLVMPTAGGTRVLSPEGLRTLRHEWAHLGLHRHMGDLRVPRWFDEGYAQWASGGFDVSEAWRLRVMLAGPNAPSMDSLSLRWPAGREQARIAYLLAASAVTYLLETGGEAGLAAFLDNWKELRSFDRALGETFGLTPGQFESNWKRHVKRRYGWLFALGNSAVFWSFLALVLLFMVQVRRKRTREKMARIRASEPPDAPAYWLEVDEHDGPGGPTPGV